MAITSTSICAAADALQGFVGFNGKTGQHIVRFSEDSFGLDVAAESIVPTCEFVWVAITGEVMRLCRDRLQLLVGQNIDERLNIGEPLHIYLNRTDLPPIKAMRRALPKAHAQPG
ncbi:MAG TPA: DUF2025 family protein [Pseudomonas sp.]|nr:DUF2025 family protein [Pseudomonas sp.]